MIRFPFLLTHSVENSAERCPDRIAFKCGKKKIVYRDLRSNMNQISNLLIDLGVKKGDRVGVLMNRCIETSYAIYGVMKGGGVYVPLDHKAPADRLNFLLEDCQINILLTVSSQKRKLSQLNTKGVTIVEVDKIDWKHTEQAFNTHRTIADDPAYILYTSGSTGTPKGIVHTHRSGLGYAKLTVETFGISSTDIIANHAPIYFDISTLGYFSGPLSGACTVIVEDAHTIMPASLAQLIRSENITIWYSVPLALIQMLERGLLKEHDYSSLRWILYAGESFPVKHLRSLMQQWPMARYCNIYGPTETNQCTHYMIEQIPEPDAEIPIGMVWGNTDYIILDDELLIRSVTTMQGYWNNVELTDHSFYEDDDGGGGTMKFYKTGDIVSLGKNGLLYLKGRKDHQIKIRGFRVELQEIQESLMKHSLVKEAVVVTEKNAKEDKEIIAYIRTTDGELPENIRSFIGQQLPTYAMPEDIRLVEDFPRTPTGKVDRKLLNRTVNGG